MLLSLLPGDKEYPFETKDPNRDDSLTRRFRTYSRRSWLQSIKIATLG
jgi:hypothetical protein